MTNIQKPLVTIITVVYNGALTIEQTIQSVIGQTYKNIEYIIIDGKSTDNTLNIVQKYKENISCLVSEKDTGIYNAMNKGIGKANGDIIGILNSDDWYENDAVERIVDVFMALPDAGVVYGDVYHVEGDKRIGKAIREPFPRLCHQSVFVKKHIYEKYGLYDENYRLAADYEMLERLWYKQIKFVHLKHEIVNYRITGQSNIYADETLRELDKIEDIYWDASIFSQICIHYLPDCDEKIFIFGAGVWGSRVMRALNKKGMTIEKFLDNNADRWGDKIGVIEIVSPVALKDAPGYIIIAVWNREEEIIEQLKSMGIEKKRIICLSILLQEYRKKIEQRNGMCVEVNIDNNRRNI